MNIDLSYYVSVFLRRLHIFLVIAFGVTAAGVYVAVVLPPMYDAEARLLVESPQIPQNLAASTVNTDASEQLAVIEQLLMTRANLIDIADAMNVFDSAGPLSADEIVQRMRAQTSISLRRGGDVMSVAFQARDPRIAAAVANEYVTRILERTVQIRTGRAEGTFQFFEDEVDRLGSELDRQSARIVEFKNEHSGALPDSLNYRLNRQAAQQDRLEQIDRELAGLEDQRERLVQVFESGGNLQAQQSLSPEERELRDLRDQLDSALVVYSPTNPRVRLLQARVDQMEEQLAGRQDEPDEAGEDPRKTMLDMQLVELDARKDFLLEQRTAAEDELETLEASIAATPENAIALEALERDYENIRSQYNAATSRLATAATGERIELLAKGERIVVLEQATVPRNPTSPDRVMIAGMGGAAGVGLAAGVVLLLELLNQSIRRPVELQKSLGITPLMTLPYVRTRRETLTKRVLVILVILAVVIGAPTVLFAVHTYYLPLDLIIDRIGDKIMP